MNTDTSILLLLADLQQQIVTLRQENEQLRAALAAREAQPDE